MRSVHDGRPADTLELAARCHALETVLVYPKSAWNNGWARPM